MLSSRFVIITKVLLSIVALASLAGVTGAHLAPSAPLLTVWLYSAIGAGALLFAVVIAAALGLTLRQSILRRGGTDTQWLWFPDRTEQWRRPRQH